MKDFIKTFVKESNAIEGYAGKQYGPGSVHFNQHRDAYDIMTVFLATYNRPLTEKVILEIHGILMENLIDTRDRGTYRRHRVDIVKNVAQTYNSIMDGGPLLRQEIVYTPPKPVMVDNLMGKLIKFATTVKTEKHCWHLHDFFESVHPFADGNGRVGRCLLNAMRVKCGFDPIIIYDKDKQKYYDNINKWRKKHFEKHL